MMEVENNLIKNNCIDCNESLVELTSRYFKSEKLNFFGHYSFSERGRFRFISNQKICSKYYSVELELVDRLLSKEIVEGVSFPYLSHKTDLSQIYSRLFSNPMVIARQFKNKREIFIFDIKSQDPYDLYVNQFNLFENFIHYYKEASKKIIAHADKFCGMRCGHVASCFKKRPLDLGLNARRYAVYSGDRECLVSSKEYACLKLFAHGYSFSMIAEELSLSIRTVETYFERIKKKLNVPHRDQLVLLYWKNKILIN